MAPPMSQFLETIAITSSTKSKQQHLSGSMLSLVINLLEIPYLMHQDTNIVRYHRFHM